MEVRLRPWSLNDLSDLVKLADNPKIAANMTDGFPTPYTEQNGRNFLEMALGKDPVLFYAIEVDGELAGGIGIHPQQDIYRRNAELGYWIGEKYWGKGVISSAIPQMIRIAFDVLDIDRIFAKPFGRNVASQRALEKSGFILEARINDILIKNGQAEDELIYAFRKNFLNT